MSIAPTLASPDPTYILLLHRGDDGFICFRGGSDGKTRELLSIPAGELRERFPEFRDQLSMDAYFSVNGFWRKGRRISAINPRFMLVSRRQENLRYLNACFIDLDGYKLGLDSGQLASALDDATNGKLIPKPSFCTDSGRGLWAFWLLHDPAHPHLPEPAFREKLDMYRKVQRALAERLSHLKSDALDAARITRVAGSINGKSGSAVNYMGPSNKTGTPDTYTLQKLAVFLGIRPTQYQPKVPGELGQEARTTKQRAWKCLQANRLRQLEKLRSIRGGFAQGCRNRAAMLLVHLLTTNGFNHQEIDRRLDVFCNECHPRLSRSERRGALVSGSKMKTGGQTITNKCISDWLDITPEESGKLETWRPAPRFLVHRANVATGPATRLERAESRRRSIRHLIGELGGKIPSSRTMAALLRDQFGHEASHVTVRSDYILLGVAATAPIASRESGPNLFKSAVA